MQRPTAPARRCPSCLREDAWKTVNHPAGVVILCRHCNAVLATTARARSHLVERRGRSLRPTG